MAACLNAPNKGQASAFQCELRVHDGLCKQEAPALYRCDEQTGDRQIVGKRERRVPKVQRSRLMQSLPHAAPRNLFAFSSSLILPSPLCHFDFTFLYLSAICMYGRPLCIWSNLLRVHWKSNSSKVWLVQSGTCPNILSLLCLGPSANVMAMIFVEFQPNAKKKKRP